MFIFLDDSKSIKLVFKTFYLALNWLINISNLEYKKNTSEVWPVWPETNPINPRHDPKFDAMLRPGRGFRVIRNFNISHEKKSQKSFSYEPL